MPSREIGKFDAAGLLMNGVRFIAEFVLLTTILASFQTLDQHISPNWSRIASLVAWVSIVFGSAFLVNLPNDWAQKVQLVKPTTPGGNQMLWYSSIQKPTWTPPNWVFPLMWIPLKSLQVAAAMIVWDKVGGNYCHPAIVYFLAHQTLGDLWNKIFFEQRQIGFGVVVIYLFFANLIASTFQFFKLSGLAGGLIFPTNLWVLVATSLNLAIWLMNGKEALYPIKPRENEKIATD